jgi:hypothetical protein
MKHFLLKYFLVLLAGGLLTSYAEYRFDYNLYDLLKDKILAILKFLHIRKS